MVLILCGEKYHLFCERFDCISNNLISRRLCCSLLMQFCLYRRPQSRCLKLVVGLIICAIVSHPAAFPAATACSTDLPVRIASAIIGNTIAFILPVRFSTNSGFTCTCWLARATASPHLYQYHHTP